MLLSHFQRVRAENMRLRAPYRTLVSVLGWIMVVLGCVLVVAIMYRTRVALGLPLDEASLDGNRLAFLCWLVITLASVPVLFTASLFAVRALFSLFMLSMCKFSVSQAYSYVRYGQPPAFWLETDA